MGCKAYVLPSSSPSTIALHQHQYEGELRLGSRSVLLQPGDVTITPPRMLYSYRLPQDGQHLCIHFHPTRAREKGIRLPLHIHLGAEAHFVTEKMNHILSTFRGAGRRGPLGILAQNTSSAALQELLLWLALHHAQKKGNVRTLKAKAALDRLIQIIDLRLGQVLGIPGLADEVQLSQDYLAKIFRITFGVTIPRYILQRRIDVARHLLQNTGESVGSIAVRVGIPDMQYFNKQFRRFTGSSPTALRMRVA